MGDLAVIIVSTNEGRWLRPCLRSVLDHAGAIELDLVVADNESTDDTQALVAAEFPEARVVACSNRGFGHANNCALLTCDARYVLFLNPDTEVLDGNLAELVAYLDERPQIGLVGARQLSPDGTVYPTIRRAPNALRAFGEALGSEHFPIHSSWLCERELRAREYDRERRCDWTSGSFMLVRRDAIATAGFLDERFFLFGEETDFCLRIRKAGWHIVHVPKMTIVHYAGKAGINDRRLAQGTFAFLQYSRKNFSPLHRAAFLSALALRHSIRSVAPGRDREYARSRRTASRRALRVLVGREGSPFGSPPEQARIVEAPSTRDRDERRLGFSRGGTHGSPTDPLLDS